MAVKTITIDMEAYTLLSRLKGDGKSFSQVIKAHFQPSPTAGRFREMVRTARVSGDTLVALDDVVKNRPRHPARAARL
jgi:hypothetical protein